MSLWLQLVLMVEGLGTVASVSAVLLSLATAALAAPEMTVAGAAMITQPGGAQVATGDRASDGEQRATPAPSAVPADGTASPGQDLQAARALVRDNPSSAKAHYELAECLRKAGRQREAAQEYLEATEIDPLMYLAYHQISLLKADGAVLEEAIARLTRLKEKNQKDLMLRVALSELLEKKGSYYQAARVLVEISYMNVISEKYLSKVNSRIHYLLAMARAAQPPAQSPTGTEELDVSAPPLPESTLQRNLSAAKAKEPKVMRGVGHARLLP